MGDFGIYCHTYKMAICFMHGFNVLSCIVMVPSKSVKKMNLGFVFMAGSCEADIFAVCDCMEQLTRQGRKDRGLRYNICSDE